MKKNYIAPEIMVVEMELETIVAESSVAVGINDGEKGDEKEDFVSGHRGVWGNLWE